MNRAKIHLSRPRLSSRSQSSGQIFFKWLAIVAILAAASAGYAFFTSRQRQEAQLASLRAEKESELAKQNEELEKLRSENKEIERLRAPKFAEGAAETPGRKPTTAQHHSTAPASGFGKLHFAQPESAVAGRHRRPHQRRDLRGQSKNSGSGENPVGGGFAKNSHRYTAGC